MSTVLIVDDEPAICWALEQALVDHGHRVLTVATGEDALELADHTHPDVVLMDVRLPGSDGIAVMKLLHRRYAQTPVIVMTAFGNLETAVDAVSHGAYEYLTKPFDLDDAVEVIRRALDRSHTISVSSSIIDDGAGGFLLGVSKPMQTIFRQIALVADRDLPVLITGESGTGKELIATAIHRYGKRASGPFVPICVPAMSENLVESELFGHARGAFTGAESDRKGLLTLADTGTAFFDEIGDVALSTQVKLLRVLETKNILSVGSNEPRTTDFRLVAATNRNVEQMVAAGLLREDLYYRLNVFRIEVPPLRSRVEDIPVLARHFLQQIEGCAQHVISDTTMERLLSRPWYGNVRELKNVIERATIEARSHVIEPHDLPDPISPQTHASGRSRTSLSQATAEWLEGIFDAHKGNELPEGVYEKFLEEIEPVMLRETLKATAGNRQEAARLLGIHRQTLREKLRKYGLDHN
ncbi:MAG: sigma-54-dependent transcriptional regulator [Planctomycetaceae bacterium]